jgi:hypothetical protein
MENGLRAFINKVKDLDRKLQCKQNDKQRRYSRAQIHNLGFDQVDNEHLEHEMIEEERYVEDDGHASQVVEAYLAEEKA